MDNNIKTKNDTYHSLAHLEQMRRPIRQSTDRMFGDKHSWKMVSDPERVERRGESNMAMCIKDEICKFGLAHVRGTVWQVGHVFAGGYPNRY